MPLDKILNQYSLIHYEQQMGLQAASDEERLVVTTDASGEKSLAIRTLSLGERLLALFGMGPASEENVRDYINTQVRENPELDEKVRFIFNEQIDRPSAVVALSSLASCYDREMVNKILRQPDVRDNINTKVVGDDTALMQAIRKNNKEAFYSILDVPGVKLDPAALLLAIELERLDLVKELVARGCTIPVKAYLDAKNHPHMLTALKSGSEAQKSSLLVDAVDHNNDAALKKIANDIHGIDMLPALEHALAHGKDEMVDKLMGHGIDSLKASEAALHVWARGQIDHKDPLFQKLCKDITYLGEISPLECNRSRDDYLALFKTLDSQLDNEAGTRLLIKAQEKGNWPLVEALLVAKVPLQPERASKILIRAASRGSPEVVQLLLERGADPLYEDGHGHSALERAQFRLTLTPIPGGRDQADAVLGLLQGPSPS